MLLVILSRLFAHEDPTTHKMLHSISLGYQYRTMVAEENFRIPHCSVIQYGGVFYVSNNPFLNAFVAPSIGIVGLNQSVVQPNASVILGFQLGSFFTIGSGPLISTRASDENPFFPQMIIETSILLHIDNTVLPLQFGYVPASQSLSQYQFLLSYRWQGRGRRITD